MVLLPPRVCVTMDRCVVLFPSCVCDSGQMQGLISIMCVCVTMDRCKGLFPFVAVCASLTGRQGYQSIKGSERMGHKDA